MENELQKLRIDKSQKARRDEKSRWPWVVVIIVLLLLSLGAWKWARGHSATEVATIRIRMPEGAMNESDLITHSANGYLMAAHKIELATKVVGRVSWVGVEMGDKVEKGQVLVRLEDEEYKARFAQQQGQLDAAKAKLAELLAGSRPQEILQAKANVDQAAAELANAERNYKRLLELESNRTVSTQEVADAETLVKSRKAQVDAQQQLYEMARLGPRQEQIDAQRAVVRQLEGGLALAKVDLDNTLICSTVTGTVLARNVEVGEFVTTGFVGEQGAKGYVVSIADLTDLRVELDVSQNDFSKVSAKQPCWIKTDAYPDRRYEGVVDLISPEANRQKATVQVRVKVLNPDELLKPDMNATVSFLSPEKLATTRSATTAPTGERPVLRVPASAVRGGAVFVVEAGKAVQRTVTTGSTDAKGDLEIKKGLIGGEDLITNPPATLKEGDPVRAREM